MRIEKSYHRADLRRLSTESYVKQEGKSLSTQWLWYRKEESGDWIKYGVTVRWSKWKMEGICGITTELWKKFRFAQDQTLMRCTIPNICQGKKNHQKSNFFSFSIVRNNYHAKSPAKKLRASMTTTDNFSFHTLSNYIFVIRCSVHHCTHTVNWLPLVVFQTGESDLKQEDLETAFLRREGNYTFTRNGQEFRLQFFMNPMCEKSFRPYSKKTVRRRPAYKSPEDIKKLLGGNVEKKSWFSLRNLFRWR